MEITLNEKQEGKLADFLFDIAKGLILGIFGMAIVKPTEFVLISSIAGSFFAIWFIKIGLDLLKN